MKITLSKSQWKQIGEQSGWLKKYAGKDVGQIGTISLSILDNKDAKPVGALPISITFNFDKIGEVDVFSNSNINALLQNVFNEIARRYSQPAPQPTAQPQPIAQPKPPKRRFVID